MSQWGNVEINEPSKSRPTLPIPINRQAQVDAYRIAEGLHALQDINDNIVAISGELIKAQESLVQQERLQSLREAQIASQISGGNADTRKHQLLRECSVDEAYSRHGQEIDGLRTVIAEQQADLAELHRLFGVAKLKLTLIDASLRFLATN